MNVLKATFCLLRKLGESGRVVLALFLIHNLDLRSSHFKVTMMHNFEAILWEENNLNLITKLWHKITINPILNHKLSKFMKLVEIEVVQVFGLIENKHILTLWTSWKIGCEISWTLTWIFAPTFQSLVFYSIEFPLWSSHCQMARQNPLLRKCVDVVCFRKLLGFFGRFVGCKEKSYYFWNNL